MQGTMHVLNRSGDTALAWDTESTNKDPQSGPLDQAFVDAEFERLVNQEGHMAFGTKTDEKGKEQNDLLKKFDPTYPKITVSPRFVGG